MNIKSWVIIAAVVLPAAIVAGFGSGPLKNAWANTLWANTFTGEKTIVPDTDKVWKSETIAVSVPAFLNANTEGGSISVRSHDRDEITIHIYVKQRGEYITDEDTPVRVTINESRNGVEITAKTERSGFFRRTPPVSVSYDILVPRQTEVRSRTSGGSVSATGIDHNVTLITSGGPVTVEEISGDVLARTSGGPISVRQVTGNLTARTSGGGIRVSDATGTMNTRTSGGPIRLDRIAGNIEARTSGGSITADVRAIVDYLNLSTSGGSISVDLPRHKGLDITARGGSIQNNLDDLTGEIGMRRLNGSVGGGGVPVELRTSGGSVRISYNEYSD